MMPEIVPYKAEHAIDLGTATEEAIRWAVLRERMSIAAFSAMLDGKCVGCAGVGKMYGQVYGCWGEFSDEIKKHPLWFNKTVRLYFAAVLASFPWQRIEAIVLPSLEKNCRWIEWLGFRPQSANGVPCLELKVGPNGENGLRYVMVR